MSTPDDSAFDGPAGPAPTSLSRTRYLLGSLAWLLTLQFFVLEAVAIARFPGYSRTGQVISDLGTDLSPGAALMNASFIAQGVLIVAGGVLLRPGLIGLGGRLAVVLLSAAGVGTLLVGLFPSDTGGAAHTVGAILYLLGGGLGLMALAYAVRPRSEAVGTTLALLGLVGVIATVLFGTAVTGLLGEGGTERLAAYVLPLGLAVTSVLLWRQQDDWQVAVPTGEEATLTKRQRRELEKAEAFDRARERDEALEALARKKEQERGAPAGDDDDPDDYDEERAWRTPRQR
ncbi:DUF998 domain-containing protein [Modestobacter sp. Leaf380]|uniref:DUF998 domain-containing protein n=1 Tax=Modestobacter sp. Leaf380 TaxID=1736356 RepID=UPI001F243ECB|nr:DUF998 domain-containing protein [Modestobacter sp. Leaf380]